MPPRASSAELSRDRAVRAIVSAHRALTCRCAGIDRDAERRTLVACSGGADSTALALALASSSIPLVLAHVVHDVRPESEALADRDHVRSLASSLGVSFKEASVRIRGLPGNLEANARRARYAALAGLAAESDAEIVATGHQADDVFETLLMRLMRGAGPRGLAGPAPCRPLSASGAGQAGRCWLVRPMLSVTRADAERICRLDRDGPGSNWRLDSTNDDRSLLRNGVRARIVPLMRELAPGVELRAARASETMRDVLRVWDERVTTLLRDARRVEDGMDFSRRMLAEQPRALIGAVIRAAILEVCGDQGIDRVGASEMSRAVRAVLDGRADRRSFGWGIGGSIVVVIDHESVTIQTGGGGSGSEADRAGRALRP